MLATVAVVESQVTSPVWLRLRPSENSTVAVYCRLPPLGTVALAGVTSMETGTASVTVSVAEGLLMLPLVAVMAVLPLVVEVALPFSPLALLMVATEVVPEFQTTLAVMSLGGFSAVVSV